VSQVVIKIVPILVIVVKENEITPSSIAKKAEYRDFF
jgi:hypothetical protein